MRARRLIDSCILATTLRTAPVKGMLGMTPAFWIEPSTRERVAQLTGQSDPNRNGLYVVRSVEPARP